MLMLFESDVINATCAELESRGYQITQRLSTTQRGDDIIALTDAPEPHALHVEAKGETSSREGSQRYGRPFDSAQVRIHVAEAFYKAAEIFSRSSGHTVIHAGIALPDNDLHRRAMRNIEPVVKQLGVVVFWVKAPDSVQVTWGAQLNTS